MRGIQSIGLGVILSKLNLFNFTSWVKEQGLILDSTLLGDFHPWGEPLKGLGD